MIQFCAEDSRDFWKVYYSNERPYFLAFFPYNKNYTPYLLEVTSSVLCEVKKIISLKFPQITDLARCVYWVYCEILVLSMSFCLITRFDQLTNRMEHFRGKILSEILWNDIYTHYALLCDLVGKADEILSPIILIYSFSNLYFICEKIFRLFE